MSASTHIRLTAILLTGFWVWLALPAAADAAVLKDRSGIRCLDGTPPPGSVITQADAAVAGLRELKDSYSLKIVYCFRSTLQDVTYILLKGVTDTLRPTFYTAMALMLTLFGVRIMTGKYQALSVDTFIFLSKICIAMFLFEQLIDYYPMIYSAIDDLTSMVTFGFRGDTAVGGEACTEPANLPASYAVWWRGDCILKRIFGFGALGVGAGIVGIILASLFTGGWGVGVCVVGISAILSFLMMLIRCVYHVFASYLMIAFMVAISPLLIPFIFIEVKKTIFRRWGDYIIAGVIQPAMIVAYLMFMLKVINFFVFDTSAQATNGGPRQIYSIASLLPDPRTCIIVERQLFTGGEDTDPNARDQSTGGGGTGNNGAGNNNAGNNNTSNNNTSNNNTSNNNTSNNNSGFFGSITGKLIMWSSNMIDIGRWFRVPALSCKSTNGNIMTEGTFTLLGRLCITLFALLVTVIVTRRFADEIPEFVKGLTGSSGVPLGDMLKSSSFGQNLDKAEGAAEQLLAAVKNK